MKKVKIGSLFASLKIGGGVEKVQANLSLTIKQLGHEFIHILSEDNIPRNLHTGKIISLQSPFIKGFGIKKIYRLFIDAWKVSRIVSTEKIDILIGQGDYFFMVSGLTKLFGFKGKTIAIVHTTIGIRPTFIIRILRFFLNLHDKIVLISKEELENFKNKYHFPTEKLALIYNTISTDNIDKLVQEDIKDISFTPFTYIHIGRLSYQKGQERLLRAFDKVYAYNQNTQLLILGDGELKSNLKKQVKNLKSNQAIHFLGNKKNIYKYLDKSDCFVLSSRFEGFPMVLIEAANIGIPIISTNCPTGPSELLNIGDKKFSKYGIIKGEIGYLVDEKTAEKSLTSAMIRVLTGEKIYYNTDTYREKFSIQKNRDKWEMIIKALS